MQGAELPETDNSLNICYATTLLRSYIPNLWQASESQGWLLTHTGKAQCVWQTQLYLNGKSLVTWIGPELQKIRLSNNLLVPGIQGFIPHWANADHFGGRTHQGCATWNPSTFWLVGQLPFTDRKCSLLYISFVWKGKKEIALFCLLCTYSHLILHKGRGHSYRYISNKKISFQ